MEPVWYKLQNQKDICIFYNTATGRYSSAIPEEKIKSVCFYWIVVSYSILLRELKS